MFITVLTVRGRIDDSSILSVKLSITIKTMLNWTLAGWSLQPNSFL